MSPRWCCASCRVCIATHRNDLSLVSGKWYSSVRSQSSSDNRPQDVCRTAARHQPAGGPRRWAPGRHTRRAPPARRVPSRGSPVDPTRRAASTRSRWTSSTSRRWHPYSSADHTAGSRPGSHVHIAVPQDGRGRTDPLLDGRPGGRGLTEVVGEAALCTFLGHRDG